MPVWFSHQGMHGDVHLAGFSEHPWLCILSILRVSAWENAMGAMGKRYETCHGSHGKKATMPKKRLGQNVMAPAQIIDKISILLCEGPKLNISMIFGFLSPGEPLFIDLNIPKYWKYKKTPGIIFEKYYFVNMEIWLFGNMESTCTEAFDFFDVGNCGDLKTKSWKVETHCLNLKVNCGMRFCFYVFYINFTFKRRTLNMEIETWKFGNLKLCHIAT